MLTRSQGITEFFIAVRSILVHIGTYWVQAAKYRGECGRECREHANGSYIFENGLKIKKLDDQLPRFLVLVIFVEGRRSAEDCSLTQRRPESPICYTVPPSVGLKIQMFLTRSDQEAPGQMLWNQNT